MPSAPAPSLPASPRSRLAALWERHARWLAPLLTLAGIYLLHDRASKLVRTLAPDAPLSRPLRDLPAHLYQGWDGIHYFSLAQHFDTFSWPPLYPLALRALGSLFSVDALPRAAVLVNLGAHLAIVYLAFAFVRGNPRLQGVPAWLFATLLLLYPGHNVFFANYSESLFLALALGTCVAWQRGALLVAGVLCGLCLLVRNMGMYLGAALLLVELARALRERPARPAWGRLLGAAAWVPFFVGWNLWVREVGGTDLVAATAGWQQELLTVHVPAAMSPKLWVLGYLTLPGHKEFLFFWGAVAAGVWCWRRALHVEALFIALFLLSHALYLYRPFPFTRYVSVLFPLALMAADLLKRWPPLQALAVALALTLSTRTQALLFLDRMGEP